MTPTKGTLRVSASINNDGSVPLMADDGDDSVRIASVDCQTKFKRGDGWRTECSTRQANADRLALAWNCHDDLVAALEALSLLVQDIPAFKGDRAIKAVTAARAALAKAKAP